MNLRCVVLICFITFVHNDGEILSRSYSSEKFNKEKNNPKKTSDIGQGKLPKAESTHQSLPQKATKEADQIKDSSSLSSVLPGSKKETLSNSNPSVIEEKSKRQNGNEIKSYPDQSQSHAAVSTQNASKIVAEDISGNRATDEEPSIPSYLPLPAQDTSSTTILLVSLGGGEDELLVSQMAWLFYRHDKNVVILLYGEGEMEASFPKGVKIINIPVDETDPLRPDRKSVVGLTPEDASRGEWVSGSILWARIAACRHLIDVEENVRASEPSIIVSPLFLHDICVLALADRLQVPVVGILTSRVGAWWTWAQLGVLPPLSTVAVPLTFLNEGSFWDRAANLGHHYNYMSCFRQQWQVKAMAALSQSWNTPSLTDLYAKVSRLLYAWDPIVDPFAVLVPTAIPIGGFTSTFRGEVVEDVLESAIVNRAGIVVVIPGTLEVWMGWPSIDALKEALEKTAFTVIWKATHSHLLPNTTTAEEKGGKLQTEAKFIFTKKVPLNDILNHPRHRLLVSTCGESDVMAAVHFGSPLLCLPVTTDQHLAATEIRRLGMGEMLLAGEATVGKVEELLRQLTSGRSYRLRARNLAEDLHDQPLTPSERLVFHVENVIRKPHSVRHKICGSTLPLLQQTNADVYLVVVALLNLVLIALFFALGNLYPFLSNALKVKKE